MRECADLTEGGQRKVADIPLSLPEQIKSEERHRAEWLLQDEWRKFCQEHPTMAGNPRLVQFITRVAGRIGEAP